MKRLFLFDDFQRRPYLPCADREVAAENIHGGQAVVFPPTPYVVHEGGAR